MSVEPRPMPNGTVQYSVDDAVALIRLDRPDSLNSMNDHLMADISSAIAEAEADPLARVVVLTGTGRGFCSGADLNAVGPPPADSTKPRGDAVDGMDRFFNPALRAIKNCSVPTVARVNGVAAGGGLGLALACDITIAARSAFFVATFGPRLGIVPDLGSTWSLPGRVGRARAMGMAMLGDRITAEQAEQWGMIYAVVDDDELDAEIARATTILGRTSGPAMQRIRDAIDSASTRSFSDQLDVERDHQRVLIPMNMLEGANAFLEKRDPIFD
ncbi:1,2-epoxyphenylacetyl-CoA isomerase [Nymphon striatum]|nr:1,2-epoxyphenylacetyl-CoA isomerase [Nymphon striatum]